MDEAELKGHQVLPIFGLEQADIADPERTVEVMLDTLFAGFLIESTTTTAAHDRAKGRRSESDAINGIVVAEGERLDLPTPANAAVIEVARRIDRRELAPGVENLALMLDLAGDASEEIYCTFLLGKQLGGGRMRRLKIEDGLVISMDPTVGDLRRGDILIEDGVIVEVAPTIEVEDAEVIDASKLIVMPGLVDPHRHLWYAAQRAICYDGVLKTFEEVFWPRVGQVVEPPDVYDCTRAAVADALNSGVTSVLDFCHVINSDEHAEQAVQAHLDSDMRVVFGFGPSMKRKLDELAGNYTGFSDWGQARRMQTEIFDGNDRLTLALAISGPELSTVEEAESDIAIARENGFPVTTHLGLPQGLPAGAGVSRLAEKVELGPDLQFVHCCNTESDEFRLIAEAGATAAFSPQCEIAIGMGIPPTGRAKAAGVPPVFGCDSVTGSNGDQFDEARIGLMIERTLGAKERYDEHQPVTDPSQLRISSREALEAITINAARSMWLGDQVGSLTPGKRADITMLRMDDHNLAPLSNVVETIVCSANAGNVDTVLVDGRIVKRDGVLLTKDADAVVANLKACRDRLFKRGGFEEGFAPAPAS